MRWRRYAAIVGVLSAMIVLPACTSGSPAAIKFTSRPNATITVGQNENVRIAVSDNAAVLHERGQLPVGLIFHSDANGTASLTGVPASGSGGRYQLSLTANDGTGRASQVYSLIVYQIPSFPSINNTTFAAKTMFNNKTLILSTGYPAAKISYTGTLPSGFKFTAFADGTATISASPGVVETPCDSQIAVIATNIAGHVSMPLLVKIDSLACPCNIVCGAIEKNPVSFGKAIYNGGRYAGRYIVKGGKVVGRTVARGGTVAADDSEIVAEDGAVAFSEGE